MKKIFILAAFLLPISFTNPASASTLGGDKKIELSQVPMKAIETIKSKYPAAKDLEWYKDGKTIEAEFKENNSSYEVTFDGKGEWLMSSKEIKSEMLPLPVKNAVKVGYSAWAITNAQEVMTAKMGTLYKVDFLKGVDKKEIYFTKAGKTAKVEKY